MALDVTIDIIDGATITEENGIVVEATRVAIVSGLISLGSDSVLSTALAALGPLVIPDQHPVHTNLFVASRIPRALSPFQVEVTIKYTVADPGNPASTTIVSGGVALEQIQTQIDPINGGQITVSHGDVVQGGEITLMVPRREVTFERVEALAVPGDVSNTYTGKVNSAAWNGLANIGEWMCMGVSFDLLDGSVTIPTWRMRYSFRHNPDKWDPAVIFIDPETGKPPPGLISGTGFKTIPAYTAVNFNSLSLF